jgi:hypothetical protein
MVAATAGPPGRMRHPFPGAALAEPEKGTVLAAENETPADATAG